MQVRDANRTLFGALRLISLQDVLWQTYMFQALSYLTQNGGRMLPMPVIKRTCSYWVVYLAQCLAYRQSSNMLVTIGYD